MKRKSLAFILALAMVLTMVPVYAFADDSDYSYRYVAIGSDALLDFGVVDTYSEHVHDFLIDTFGVTADRVSASDLALSGMRYEDLRVILETGDAAYKGDAYTAWKFDGDINTEHHDEWVERISKADLITLDAGLNGVSSFIFNKLIHDTYPVNFTDIYGDNEAKKETFEDFRSIITEELTKAIKDLAMEKLELDLPDEIVHTILDSAYEFTDLVPYAFASYCNNFDKCVKLIKKINPTANIVVMGIPEFQEVGDEELSLVLNLGGEDNKSIELSVIELINILIDVENIYARNLSPERRSYTYVPMTFKGGLHTFADNLIDESLTEDQKNYIFSKDNTLSGVYLKNMIQLEALTAANHPNYAVTELADDYDAVAKEIARDMIFNAMKKSLVSCSSIGINDLRFAMDKILYIKDDLLSCVVKSAIDNTKDGILYTSVGALEVTGDDYSLYDDLSARSTILTREDGLIPAFSILVRAEVGGSFFTRPNEIGHKQMANAVIGAVAGDISKDQADQGTFEKLAIEEIQRQIDAAEARKEAFKEAIKEEVRETSAVIRQEAKDVAIHFGNKVVRAIEDTKAVERILVDNFEDVHAHIHETIEDISTNIAIGGAIVASLYEDSKTRIASVATAIGQGVRNVVTGIANVFRR